MTLTKDEIDLIATSLCEEEANKPVDEQIEKFVKHLEAEDKKRYEVKFDSKVTARYSADSMVTARYSADVEMIQTYDMDIRKILEDQILKDMDIPKELMHGRQNR